MPVVGVVGNAALIGGNASGAGVGHCNGLSLVPGAATEAAVVGGQARLPVVGVIGNASLIVVNASRACGH